MSIDTAIILAAGKGTRLRDVTGDSHPKPLTPVGGTPLIEYSIRSLQGHGVDRILLGCGYMIESFHYLKKKYAGIEIVHNPHYDDRASIYTLQMFEDIVRKPFLLLESDLMYDPGIIPQLLQKADTGNLIVTSKPLPLEDNVYFESEEGVLQDLSKNRPSSPEGVMTGIWLLSEGLIQRFHSYCKRHDVSYNVDYEMALANYSANSEPIQVFHEPELLWCEIDNENHLEYASSQVLPEIREKFPGYSQ